MDMPIAAAIPAITAVATVGSGVMSAISGMDAADAQEDALNQQGALTAEQAEMARLMRERYEKAFIPLEDELIKEVQLPPRLNPNFQATVGGIDKRYGDLRGNMSRMFGGRSPYGSGAKMDTMKSLELNRTKDLAGAESAANQAHFGNMLSVSNLGRSLPNQAMSGLSGAGTAYGNMASMYGSQADKSFSSMGGTVGNLMQLYAMGGQGGAGGGFGNMGSLFKMGG
jgi:hypothetical protein